jgi:GINS complex subunit 3
MKKDSKVELPIWLGEMLSLRYILSSDSFVSPPPSPFHPVIPPYSQPILTPPINPQTSEMMNTSSLVSLSIPTPLSPRVFNALRADPRTVDLRSLASHFYNLATRLLEMYVEDITKGQEQEIIRVLSEVCIYLYFHPHLSIQQGRVWFADILNRRSRRARR